MEVHQHIHPDSHRNHKKLTHYFWEFLMLFLAVFCGFLAENQREHFIEHKREKQYIRSMIRDVSTDTVNINDMITRLNNIQKTWDSLISGFDEYSKHFIQAGERQFRWLMVEGFPDFIYTDRTMQQLKNAGGLRLIRNLIAADSIISYDAAVRDILIELEPLERNYIAIRDFRTDNFSRRRLSELRRNYTDAEIEKMKISLWTTWDSKTSDKFYNLILNVKSVVESRIVYLNGLKLKGARLIELLTKEYHLK
jgi:hypothetical protein